MIASLVKLATIAIVGAHGANHELIEHIFEATNYFVISFDSIDDLLAAAKHQHISCVLIRSLLLSQECVERARWLISAYPITPVILLAEQCSLSTAVDAMKAGATDLILEPFKPERLLTSVNDVINLRPFRNEREEVAKCLRSLTKQEIKVMDLITRGFQNKEIAGLMGISWRTVESYRRNVMRKMQVGTLAELVAITCQTDIETRFFPDSHHS